MPYEPSSCSSSFFFFLNPLFIPSFLHDHLANNIIIPNIIQAKRKIFANWIRGEDVTTITATGIEKETKEKVGGK